MHMNAISAFLFFDRAHVLESREIIISGCSSARSWIRDEYGVLQLSSFSINRSIGPLEYRGWLRPSHEMFTLTFSLSFSLFLLFSVFVRLLLSLYLFSPTPTCVYVCVEVEELQHPLVDVSRLAIIIMDRTFCPPHQPIRQIL